jgi:hypothetical protein
MNLPNGAAPILKARLEGSKPAEMLIVSLIGRIEDTNHTIYANAAAEYDWRFLRGLKVCVYVNNGCKFAETMKAIAKCRPEYLGLYNVDQFAGAHAYYLPRVEDIEKPKSQWRHVLDFLPWTKWQNEEFTWGH